MEPTHSHRGACSLLGYVLQLEQGQGKPQVGENQDAAPWRVQYFAFARLLARGDTVKNSFGLSPALTVSKA